MALLEHQAALATRPKARRTLDEHVQAVNLTQPVAGQNYAKLPFLGSEAFLVELRGEVRIELTAEWFAFFEDWLAARYRRGNSDDQPSEQLVFFPTLHLRRDELAGLLRFPVVIGWHTDDRPFCPPTYVQRKKQLFPSAPTGSILRQPSSEPEHAIPYFIDTQLLRDTLGVDGERIEDLFRDLRRCEEFRPRAVVEALCALLEERNGSYDEPANPLPSCQEPQILSAAAHPRALLSHLYRAVTARLERSTTRARAYNVALVVNCDRVCQTWQLQRDIETALALLAQRGALSNSPLYSYLTGRVQPSQEALSWGRWRQAAPTRSQRTACQLATGSKLAAVQGPPGTGKTSLILDLIAHTLVQKVSNLADGSGMGQAITVVTSTNNRAVDNVIDPLGRQLDGAFLGLSLRAGSRRIVEKVTLPELTRARDWIAQHELPDQQARTELSIELGCFRKLWHELRTHYRLELNYRASETRKKALQLELGQLRPSLTRTEEILRTTLRHFDPMSEREPSTSPSIEAHFPRLLEHAVLHTPAIAALSSLGNRLSSLKHLLAQGERTTLAKVQRHWRRTRSRQLARLEAVLGIELPLGLPPQPQPNTEPIETWEQATEIAISTIKAFEDALGEARIHHRLIGKARKLENELARLLAEPATPPPARTDAEQAELDARHLELFESAVRVREAWAIVERDQLLEALAEAISCARETRSLRDVMPVSNESGNWLRQLFPAWGSTLLSLGNVFPARAGCIDSAIIDEAGQCHPAYAVAALLRAKRALVIGDVNQLEPVVGLTTEDEQRILGGLKLTSTLAELAPYRSYDGSTTSAQSLADRAVDLRPTLSDHFRCQAPIAAICESLCDYGLITRTPSRTRADVAPLLAAAVLHLAVQGSQERFAGSWFNQAELSATLWLTSKLLTSGVAPEDLGIITPYRGQLERLWRKLRRAHIPLEQPPAELLDDALEGVTAAPRGLAVGTVHRFQGGERSIILFTTTVTDARSLEFLNARVNLVNVAASRAREHLITIGDGRTLRAGRYTRYLVERAMPLIL